MRRVLGLLLLLSSTGCHSCVKDEDQPAEPPPKANVTPRAHAPNLASRPRGQMLQDADADGG